MSRFELDRSGGFTSSLFFRRDSRKAGDLLLAELRAKRGKMTRSEMSAFAWELQSGKRGFKFSRVNFYRNVLATFLRMGLIGVFDSLDPKTRKTVKAYQPILQHIPTRRPDNPSLWYHIYELCSWWNELMF